MALPTIGEEIFFGRTEQLLWIEKKLENCIGKSILLGIEGIPGAGKSALLRQCKKKASLSLIVDFEKKPLYSAMRDIAKKANLIGMETPRYNILMDIKIRFMDGLVPSTDERHLWVKEFIKDIAEAFPVVGSLAKLGISAIIAGPKIKRVIQKRYGKVNSWLRENLGENYGTRLCEAVIDHPDTIPGLILDALANDLNHADTGEIDSPLIVLLDSFEHVDDKSLTYTYPTNNMKIKESELWHIFLSKLNSAVCIIAGRVLPILSPGLGLSREDISLSKLDVESCKRILESRGVDDENRRDRIVEISYQNPYVINQICDIWVRGDLNLEEVESLRSESLEEVRELVWRFFMKRQPHLSHIAFRASFLPYFDMQILSLVHPILDPALWRDFIRLSFVNYEEPYWSLDELTRELAIGQYGEGSEGLASEVYDVLYETYQTNNDITFLGLALSLRSLFSESDAIRQIREEAVYLKRRFRYNDILHLLESLRIEDPISESTCDIIEADTLSLLGRIIEAERILRNILEFLKTGSVEEIHSRAYDIAMAHEILGIIYTQRRNWEQAERILRESLRIRTQLAEENKDYLVEVSMTLTDLGILFLAKSDEKRASKEFYKALKIQRKISKSQRDREYLVAGTLGDLSTVYLKMDKDEIAERLLDECLSIYYRLAETEPELYKPKLAKATGNMGIIYRNMRKHEESEQKFLETLEIIKNLPEFLRQQYQHHLADTVHNLAGLYTDMGRYIEAKDLFEIAIRIYREYSELIPEPYNWIVSSALRNYASLLSKMGDFTGSTQALQLAAKYQKVS